MDAVSTEKDGDVSPRILPHMIGNRERSSYGSPDYCNARSKSVHRKRLTMHA